MAVIIKSKGLGLLTDKGADANGIATLKSLGATISKDQSDSSFSIHIGVNTWKLIGGLASNPGGINQFVMGILTDVEAKNGIKAPAHAPEWAGGPSVPVQQVLPLRDAKALYQRVIGTSEGSVYVVVALSSESKIRVAAKIEHSMSLSVRVEGDGLAEEVVVATLKAQALTLKAKPTFKYMSGHYACNAEAPPNKVLGAILLGSGIKFDTPMPDLLKVVEGSA